MIQKDIYFVDVHFQWKFSGFMPRYAPFELEKWYTTEKSLSLQILWNLRNFLTIKEAHFW